MELAFKLFNSLIGKPAYEIVKKDDDAEDTRVRHFIQSHPIEAFHKLSPNDLDKRIKSIADDLKKFPLNPSNIDRIKGHVLALGKCSERLQCGLVDRLTNKNYSTLLKQVVGALILITPENH